MRCCSKANLQCCCKHCLLIRASVAALSHIKRVYVLLMPCTRDHLPQAS